MPFLLEQTVAQETQTSTDELAVEEMVGTSRRPLTSKSEPQQEIDRLTPTPHATATPWLSKLAETRVKFSNGADATRSKQGDELPIGIAPIEPFTLKTMAQFGRRAVWLID